MYDFFKKIFFKVIYLTWIVVSPFKKFNSAKKNSLCKKNHSEKQTHSVRHNLVFKLSIVL